MLSHHRGGSGELLVLVHGLGGTWRLWRPVLPALESRYEVLAVDLPGFGDSPVAPRADVAAFADAVAALAGRPFHAVGSSLGGGVALELGRRGLARSVTAFAPIGFWGPLGRRWCQASVTAGRVAARGLGPSLPRLAATGLGRSVLFGLFYGRPGQVDPGEGLADARALAAAPGFAAARAAFAGHRFGDPGALDRIPVTVAWGGRDLVLPVRQARRAAAALPSARHVRLPGCGHLPFGDDPGTCARLIAETAIDSLPTTREAS
ncbi:hydrolase [Catellatospora sp. TT07R-123]|uniref:alpha/beta fold hydrolase n=1 Tax=Catellatospora sp. TT07R-123 TaxID=2733863 RepID=UPI001B19E0C5|nr:alpha/beta hydrolase [Catellatospora sp. TT07R-123]GHJ48015.1 hydrolase [Catellatospora sp. TT07R-123]